MAQLDADVVIAGFGPVGQALSLALGQAGHQVLVVERHEQMWPLPRAGHFDHEVMRIFQGLGLAEQVTDVAEPADKYVMFDSRGEILRELPRTWNTPSGWPASYHFYQPELEHVLHAGVASCPQVTVLRGWDALGAHDGRPAIVTASHVRTGQRRELRASYVIGADGANSVIRPAAASAFHDLGFRADWLVVDVALAPGVDPGTPSTGQYCDPRRPHHTARLHGRYVRWEFMVRDTDDRERLCLDESVWALLSPWLSRGEAELIRRSIYTFSSRIAEPWSRGHIALAGDAAHLMPPFLGQGMCSGLRDGATLSWMLDLVLRGISEPRLLASYESERGPHVRRYIEESVKVGQIVCVTDPAQAAERDRELRASSRQETPLQPRLGPGVISAQGGELPGLLSVQPVVASPSGRRARLDSLLGPGFQLLGHGQDPRAGLTARSLRLLERLGCRSAAICGDSGGDSGGLLRDVTGSWCAWMREAGMSAVLVRPDHYVFGAAVQFSGLDALLAELEELVCLA
jgi:2-polyprenyl-6-methoxyphenol hydroxylase-like FAD-dependent oxidoreductase